MERLMQKQSGFTLIELLLVLAIIGIISAIAVPALLGQRERAKMQATKDNTANVVADLQATLDGLSDAPSERRTDLPQTNYAGDLKAMADEAITFVTTRPNYSGAKNPYQNGAPVYVISAAVASATGTAGNVYVDSTGVTAAAGGYIHVVGNYRDAKGAYTTMAKDVSVN
jgi:prepilin-type N-terminal cleavage/methylation domain-containing protein